ncbi:Tyrosine-tRNA ligase [Escovopsis weberi]|uniref:Tyrosine--tRNA ligase n=1 Tax=Escovopsis weberi TaxID=150374 RepID=A0A0M8N4J3_ESCWE|nr:Tyrosine-tRNA ligase [Escovopsis weberi]
MAPRMASIATALRRPRLPASRQATAATSLGNACRRCISTSWLNKTAQGEARWRLRAEKIQSGEVRHTWDILEERGYIKDVAGNPKKIKELMRVKRIGAYVGVDPTADSMHVGHLLAIMPLFWLWFHGYPAATLIGGATARIGDPTGRLKDRDPLSNADISKNITKLHYQLTRLWFNVQNLRRKYEYEDDWAAKHHLLNNSMWLQGLTMYDFTKRLARHMRLGPMLSRETVKRKMTGGDGMSLSEFIYPLLQGWDFWHVYSKLGIQMQIGGSDQYGNIIAGIESLKTIRESEEAPHMKMPSDWKNEPIGFTVPLLTDSSGAKLGKSAGNAVWLDEFKTTPFELYGYFMRRSDEDVERFLKLLTFLPLAKIEALMAEHRADPSKRVAQHTLAFEVLSLVHGSQKALQEAQQHQFRFGGELPTIVKDPAEESGIVTPNNAPRSDMQLPRSVLKLSPAKILFATGLVKSTGEGHRLVVEQGAYVAAQPGQMRGLVPGNLSWTPIKLWFPEETERFVLDGKLLILRKGKHNVRIVELVSDEEWAASGLVYPGQPFTGVVRQIKEELAREAEAQGRTLTAEEVTKELKNRGRTLRVANNPAIEFPNKPERRGRSWDRTDRQQDRRAPRKWDR